MSSHRKIQFFRPHLVSAATSESRVAFLEGWLKKELPELLKKYQGQLLDVKTFPSFQRNGAELYTQREVYESTDIGLTLIEDISEANQMYLNDYSQEPGANFTLYLFWTLLQALSKVSGFNYRYIDGQWYNFDNLPLFTTMEGVHGQLDNVLLEDVAQCSWKTFCEKAVAAKTKLQNSSETTMYSYPIYAVATHITNVKFNFTALSFPSPKKGIEVERPMFVMGVRQEKEKTISMPLAIKLPHASLHPQLLSKLLMEWRKLRNVKPEQQESLQIKSSL